MQTQDAPAEIIFKLWPWLEANQKRLVGVAAAIAVAATIYYFVTEQHAQKEVEAGQALTLLLMTPPANAGPAPLANAFVQFASKYSGTVAAERARLQAATTLYAAGSYDQAQTQFEMLLSSHSSGALAGVANLGLAASLEAQGKLDEAAQDYRKIMAAFADSTVAITAKFSLARTLELQGKLNDALNYYSDVSRTPIAGSLGSEAAMHAAEIKSKLAAASKPAAP